MRSILPSPYRLLALFLAVDALFMVLHFLHVRESFRFGWLAPHAFRIDTDHGFAEAFQYLKLVLIVCLLGFLFFRRRYGVAGAWAAVFTVVFIDDALMLHEGAGAMMAARVAAPAVMGLGYSELGELLGWAVMGVALGALLLLAYLRAFKEGRTLLRGLFTLLAALVFFGVVVDMLHTLVARKHLIDALLPHSEAIVAPAIPTLSSLLQVSELSFPIAALSVATVLPALALSLAIVGEALQGALQLDLLFTLLEDGGEMVIVSLTAAYCLTVFKSFGHDAKRQDQTPDQPLPYLPALRARKRG